MNKNVSKMEETARKDQNKLSQNSRKFSVAANKVMESNNDAKLSTLSSIQRNSTLSNDLYIDMQTQNLIQNVQSTSNDVETYSTEDKLLASSNADEYIKSAIPLLPIQVAVMFFVINMVLPGIGKFLSEFLKLFLFHI